MMSRAQTDIYCIDGLEMPLDVQYDGLGTVTGEGDTLKRGMHHGNLKPGLLQ